MELAQSPPSDETAEEVNDDKVLRDPGVDLELEERDRTASRRAAGDHEQVIEFLDEYGKGVDVAVVDSPARVVAFEMPHQGIGIVNGEAWASLGIAHQHTGAGAVDGGLVLATDPLGVSIEGLKPGVADEKWPWVGDHLWHPVGALDDPLKGRKERSIDCAHSTG
jgi:hypothetical protein